MKFGGEGRGSEPIEVGIEAPAAHSKKQALIMGAFRIPGLRKIYVACGTKFGKSLSAAVCEGHAAIGAPGTKWRWIAPIYEQARVGMEYFRKILPPSPHSDIRDGAMRIELPHIGTELQFWHCKNPVSLEGAGINGNIFDEAAKCPYEAVAAAHTTVTMTRGPQGYFSTPFGKNWFHRECMEAKEHMAWALKNGRQPERIFITAPTTANPFIDPAVIAEAKRTLPDRLYRQYFLAEFLDDSSVFIGFRECLFGAPLELTGGVQIWTAPDAAAREVHVGVDWAKREDFTVFTAFSTSGGIPRLVGLMRFQGIGYVEALRELYRFSKKFKKIIMVKHDRTGVGDAIDDMLAQLSIPFEGQVFTNASKAAMVNQLMVAFETRDIALPQWQEMIHELESYTVDTNALGNTRYAAPPGMHDDIVSSLMLGYCAAREYSSDFKLTFLEDLPTMKQEKLSIDKWYRDLADDE